MNVGEYIRTKDDGIQKITFIDEFSLDSDEVFFGTDKTGHYADVSTTDIIGKPSPNIIDLIEEGDYVNGQLVHKNEENNYLYLIGIDGEGNYYEDSIKDIKTIVTKEMFEQMEYEIQ